MRWKTTFLFGQFVDRWPRRFVIERSNLATTVLQCARKRYFTTILSAWLQSLLLKRSVPVVGYMQLRMQL